MDRYCVDYTDIGPGACTQDLFTVHTTQNARGSDDHAFSIPTAFCSMLQVNPEAPSGSFRQNVLEREARNAGKEATVGLDGKVYSFIDAPSDESSAEEAAKKSALSERHFLVV